MKQPLFLMTIFLAVFLFGCSDSKEVQLVKGGNLQACPSKSVDEMVSGYMGSPSWDSGVAENGNKFVNIGGDITFQDKPVRALLQFTVDVDGGTFEFGALEFNEVPQNNFLAMGLLSNMCGESVADSGENGNEIRAEVLKGLNNAAVAKIAVTEYFEDTGKLAKNNVEAGLRSPEVLKSGDYGYGISVDNGQILILLEDVTYEEIRGKTIVLTPEIDGDSSLYWSCSGPDIGDVYLPNACR